MGRGRMSSAVVAAFVVAGCVAGGPAPPAAAAHDADVLFALRHRRGLDRFVRAVSDPASHRYRRYRSVKQLAARFGAPKALRRELRHWGSRRGLRVEVGPSGTFALARTDTVRARRLLGGAGASAARTGWAPRVPASLRGAVSAVAVLPDAAAARAAGTPRQAPEPVHPFPQAFGTVRTRTGTPAGCEAGQNAGLPAPYHGFTPNQYLTAYGHQALHRRGLFGQGVRVALVELGGVSRKDVATFASCFGLRVPPIRLHVVEGKPGLDGEDAVETLLDVQMIVAGAPGVESIDVYQGRLLHSGMLRLLSAAIGARRAPHVVSSSLGLCEPLWNRQRSWMEAVNDVLAVAAGAGISVVDAAGDNGSADCGGLGFFAVDFPTSSPYITSVGGTNVTLDTANRLVEEVPWNSAPGGGPAGGGGGLSSLFARPWWQAENGLPPQRGKPDITRLVPDVAALADSYPGYAIACSVPGCKAIVQAPAGWGAVGGTSAAAPLTAAGIALADQAARRAGQPPLGFVNPLLYRLASGPHASRIVHDVTTGSNDIGPGSPGGNGELLGCCPAHRGYDQASGWGSLKIAAFSDAARAAAARARGPAPRHG